MESLPRHPFTVDELVEQLLVRLPFGLRVERGEVTPDDVRPVATHEVGGSGIGGDYLAGLHVRNEQCVRGRLEDSFVESVVHSSSVIIGL